MADVFESDTAHYASDGSEIGTVKGSPHRDPEALVPSLDPSCGTVAELQSIIASDSLLDAGLSGVDTSMDRAMDPKLVETLLPKYTDWGLRKRALGMYVDGGDSLEDIAYKLEVPIRTVAKWAESGKWLQLYESVVRTLKKHEQARLTMNRIKVRERILNEQLDLSKKLRSAAESHMDAAETAGQLKCAAESAKLAADMEVRALGIGDSGSVGESQESEGKAAAGRQPIVQIFQGNSGLPPVRIPGKEEVIDV